MRQDKTDARMALVAELGPRNGPQSLFKRSNYFSELEPRYGIEP